MTKRALITGITGQDGAYMAKLLLSKGYKVFGGRRRSSSANGWRLRELKIEDEIYMIDFDITDPDSCKRLVEQAQPNEIYNLAAQSFVGASFTQPYYTTQATGLGALNMLEAARNTRARFYQASSSEMFGGSEHDVVQTETTPFNPKSPYAAAKVFAHSIAKIYREAYDMHVSCGICFNHESPLRGREFVTRKITHGLAMLATGKGGPIKLGNLDARRDWGFAGDFVDGMWRMVQADQPNDYVLCTENAPSVREFLMCAAEYNFDGLRFEDAGVHERLVANGVTVVEIDPQFYRPAEVNMLQGSYALVKQMLGWQPETPFQTWVQEMVRADESRVARGVDN